MQGFPLLQVIALAAGVFLIWLLRKKYQKISATEVILILVLYTAMVLLFTDPFINLVKRWVS